MITLEAYISAFGQFQVFADLEYFSFEAMYQTIFQDFMDSNNHFHDFTIYLVIFLRTLVNVCVLIDMRWCLYLKGTQNNLAWNEMKPGKDAETRT